MVSSVPAPSVRIEPPSSTIPPSTTGSPSCSAISRPTAASRSHGGNFSPQALKPKCTAVRAPVVVVDDVDRPAVAQPRVVEPSSTISTPALQAARASAASAPGLAIIVTGSNAATALATAA